MRRFRWEGKLAFGTERAGIDDARDADDLRVRLSARSIALVWSAEVPPPAPVPLTELTVSAAAASLLPLVFAGLLPWFVPATIGCSALISWLDRRPS
jgi:hypothetical protein